MTLELLTHTKRRDFQTCRRYYFHRHVRHLQIRYQKGGRRRGSAFGDALFAAESALRTETNTTVAGVDRVVWGSIRETYAEVHPNNQDEADALAVEQIKVACLVPAYLARYGLGFGLRERRERQFNLPLVNPATGASSRAFRRAGKIDGMIPLSGRRCVVVEDKLVGQIQEAMIARLPLDHQISEYVDALIQHGWAAEVYYRHTRVPGINPKMLGTQKKGDRRRESLDEFEQRLKEDIDERPDSYFNEQRLIFTTDHLEDYRRGRWGVAQQILGARREYRAAGQTEAARDYAYPMNPSRCWEWGGCEFIPLCTKREGAEDLYMEVSDNPELEVSDGSATDEYAGQ